MEIATTMNITYAAYPVRAVLPVLVPERVAYVVVPILDHPVPPQKLVEHLRIRLPGREVRRRVLELIRLLHHLARAKVLHLALDLDDLVDAGPLTSGSAGARPKGRETSNTREAPGSCGRCVPSDGRGLCRRRGGAIGGRGFGFNLIP